MAASILATKLYIPPPRPNTVPRPRLLAQLDQSHHHKLTLISAPAGCGKTTLLSSWLAQSKIQNPKSPIQNPIAWLSLDEADNDPVRFLTYVVAALQTISPAIGQQLAGLLQSPQPPPPSAVLTSLLNDLTAVPHPFLLILDDYHLIESPPINQALAFLLQHVPPHMHLIIATREDPQLPLARLRGRGQLLELRAQALRFTPDEAAEFLTHSMGLRLTAAEIAALETRTEGWIAGLQLAALSLQGQQGQQATADFIHSFTGSHHFVLDYLLEEVLHQQPAPIQTFLRHTALLNRLCAPLCDAVLGEGTADGQATLAYLERANLFIIPLDNERRWYRYHHLFGDLLRQRLGQSSTADEIAILHGRASLWYEQNGDDLEAFHHATAAHDLDRAAYLIDARGLPLQFRGGAMPILTWLQTLPTAVLDDRPALWVAYASTLLALGRVAGVEEMVQAAEKAIPPNFEAEAQRTGGDGENYQLPMTNSGDLIGRIASIRATVAVTQHNAEGIIAQGERALRYLRPENISIRASITWALGYAYYLQGERALAGPAYAEALATCEAIGHKVIAMMSAIGLGHVQEMDNQIPLAAETYHRAIRLGGETPTPPICDAYLGLGRLHYQWNDLATAEQHILHALPLAHQIETTDRWVACQLVLAQLKLAQGELAQGRALLATASRAVHQHQFGQQVAPLAAVQIQFLLAEGQLVAAGELVEAHDLPLSRARLFLAEGEAGQAVAVLGAWRAQMAAKGWADEGLKGMVLQAVAYAALGEEATAVAHLREALATAEPSGFIRLFVDEGRPMAALLARMKEEGGSLKAYIEQLLAVLGDLSPSPAGLLEPLSEREVEVLRLVAAGLSNREIGERLFLALDTVKGHNRRIYEKLQVQRRTEAVARGRELGLL